jgi:hypothetical protein
MTLATVEALINLVHWTGLLLNIALLPSKMRAIPGSYERFRANTMLIIARALVVVSCTGWSIYYSVEGRYFFSSLYILLALLWFFLLKECFDDDNWFKKQFQRLKKATRSSAPFASEFANPRLRTLSQHRA